jgi:hypothetical protein
MRSFSVVSLSNGLFGRTLRSRIHVNLNEKLAMSLQFEYSCNSISKSWGINNVNDSLGSHGQRGDDSDLW